MKKLVPTLEHSLPDTVNWRRVAETVSGCLEDPPYPPEQFWTIGPDGSLRGHYRGDDDSVTVPFRELGKLYQAIFLHSHPPGVPPTLHDTYHAVIAASPLLVVVEGGRAHLVRVWHRQAPGLVGAKISASSNLEQGIRRVRGRYDIVPLLAVEEAIRSLEARWHAFLEEE